MTAPFRTLHHICLVVADIDAAVAAYESVGIGPWTDYPPLAEYTDLAGLDRSVFRGLRYRVAQLDNISLQLCQPPTADCPQRRFLDTHGDGVFHLGFEAPDADAARQAAERLGLGVLLHGRRANGTGFDYYDTESSHAVTLLTRQSLPADADAADGPGS
jgi:catechol 2,3-dioxygenase-like lactoylglutathione lyase family enzyme